MAQKQGRIRKVLLAVDGSEQSNYAVKWYLENMHQDDDEVLFAHIAVYPMPPYKSGVGLRQETINKLQVDADSKFQVVKDKVLALMEGHNVQHTFLREEGSAGYRLCHVAKERDVTFIVMGTRGLGKIKRTIVGSVSDYVLHHATVPVTVCKQ